MNERLTLATSAGLPWMVLAFHVATGLLALVAGLVAVAAPKGGAWHRRAGLVFVGAMFATGIAIAAVSTLEGKSPGGGLLIVYLVATAWITVQSRQAELRRVSIGLMVMAYLMAASGFFRAFAAIGEPRNLAAGPSSGMLFLTAVLILLGANADRRMLRAGGYQGRQRLTRHLTRMCLALFIATGSFFIGQMKTIPEPVRVVPLLFALGLAPLAVLAWWRWHLRSDRRPRIDRVDPVAALQAK